MITDTIHVASDLGEFVTHEITDAVTREHAISLSAHAASRLDATLDSSWYRVDSGATVWYVTWKLDDIA